MMKRISIIISCLIVAQSAIGQEPVKLGDLIDLEGRVLYKKMADELSKPNPNAPPPPPPIVIAPKAPKVVFRTETLAVYGTSATFYEGQLSMGGKLYTVREGTPVQDYVVTAVLPNGIMLTKLGGGGRGRGNDSSRRNAHNTLFAPLATQ